MKIRIAALLAVPAIIAACASPQPAASKASASTPPPSAATPVTRTVATTLTAARVTRALKARGLPIASVQIFTAADDPNHLLGRPGEYTSKTEFADTRITGEAGQGVAAGGSVEVFPDHAGAVRRARYIQALVQADPALGAEYDYVAGAVLLRVSGQLTPAQARRYKRALTAITAEVVTEPGS